MIPAAKKPLRSRALQRFSQESLDFQERISQRSGLGDGTACLPPALHILPKPIITMQVRRSPHGRALRGLQQLATTVCRCTTALISTQTWVLCEEVQCPQHSTCMILQAAREEAEQVMFEAVERALLRTGECAWHHLCFKM